MWSRINENRAWSISFSDDPKWSPLKTYEGRHDHLYRVKRVLFAKGFTALVAVATLIKCIFYFFPFSLVEVDKDQHYLEAVFLDRQ